MWFWVILAIALYIVFSGKLVADVPCNEYRSQRSCASQNCRWTCGRRKNGPNCCAD